MAYELCTALWWQGGATWPRSHCPVHLHSQPCSSPKLAPAPPQHCSVLCHHPPGQGTLSQLVAVCRDLHMLQLQFRAGPQPDRVVSVLEAARLPLEAWLLFPKMFLMRGCAQTAAG